MTHQEPPLPTEHNLNSEIIDIVLELIEQAKTQDENAQKSIGNLERALTPLKTLPNDVKAIIGRVVSEEARNALKTQNEAIEKHIDRLDSVTAKIYQAKRDLSLQNGLWYFGGFAVFMTVVLLIGFWFIPSLNEIQERQRELNNLNVQIEHVKDMKRLQLSTCDKQMCVKIDEKKCNYGKKGDRYCIAELDLNLGK